jgi:hypothetical protein
MPLVGDVDAALLALVDGRRAARAGVVRIGSLVGDVARVDLFADDAAHDRGRCATGLLHILDGERAGGDGGADLVGADPTPPGRRLRRGATSAARAAVGDATEPGASQYRGGDAFGEECVGGDAGVVGPGLGVLDERPFVAVKWRVL